MAKPLVTSTIAAPGFLGLNTQESSIQLSSGFALTAENCIIDRYGRIGARRGWTPVNATNADLGSSNIEFIFEMVDPNSDNHLISAGNNKLFVGTETLTQTTVTNADGDAPATYTITGNDWQAASIPYGDGTEATPHAYLVQAGHTPLVYHKQPATSSSLPHDHDGAYGFQVLGSAQTGGATVGSLPPGYTTTDFKPNTILSAYGRIWMADISGDRQTVYFSQLLNGSEFDGGDSGSLSINSVFPNNDQIIGLSAHNGFLIIFGRNNIAIYANPIDVTELTLADFIPNVGCVARDSIVNTGTDVIFLSDSGVRSLQRVIQEKSLPMRDLSKNVRDELVSNVASETATKIRAVYYDRDAFYLLALPATRYVYCFDLRAPLQDGAARVTIWNNIEPHAFVVTAAKELLIGKAGYVGKYYGYLDNASTYRIRYFTNYFDFDQPTSLKVLKKAGFVVIGGSAQPVSVKYGFDYTDNYIGITKYLDSAVVYEYNIADYGVATTVSETQETDPPTVTIETVDEEDVVVSSTHYLVDFSTTYNAGSGYNTSYPVHLDADGYYYSARYLKDENGQFLRDEDGNLIPVENRTEYVYYLKSGSFLGEYTGGIVLDRFTANLGGSGAVLQIGIESDINGDPLSIQKIDVGVKIGKTVI